MTETDVLVVGGGLTGLTAAAFLARNGCRVVLAERHATTSVHPKARAVNVRSMEVFRALGVEERVRAAGEAPSAFVVADTLAGEHTEWITAAPGEVAGGDTSPTGPWFCDQQRIEPILRARATELGADIRFGVQVTGLGETGSGVSALLDGHPVRARWAVAADGARSPIREQLGVARLGETSETIGISALFRADLSPALRGREIGALMARSAGAFLFARGTAADRIWQIGTFLRPGWDRDDLVGPVTGVIRAATGLPDLEPAIESVLTWTSGAQVAERFRVGRVLLAGDAAHLMPPNGAFGGNTGVQDAHGLAWRLAAVCAGAPEMLLDDYAAERKQIAELTVEQAVVRARTAPGAPPPPGQLDVPTLVLGFRYGGPPEDPANPTGEPGTRAAHVARRGGRSTLDLVDPAGFTVIGPPSAAPHPGAALRTVADEDVEPRHLARWRAVYGGAGALVRPDGVVAAR